MGDDVSGYAFLFELGGELDGARGLGARSAFNKPGGKLFVAQETGFGQVVDDCG